MTLSPLIVSGVCVVGPSVCMHMQPFMKSLYKLGSQDLKGRRLADFLKNKIELIFSKKSNSTHFHTFSSFFSPPIFFIQRVPQPGSESRGYQVNPSGGSSINRSFERKCFLKILILNFFRFKVILLINCNQSNYPILFPLNLYAFLSIWMHDRLDLATPNVNDFFSKFGARSFRLA